MIQSQEKAFEVAGTEFPPGECRITQKKSSSDEVERERWTQHGRSECQLIIIIIISHLGHECFEKQTSGSQL